MTDDPGRRTNPEFVWRESTGQEMVNIVWQEYLSYMMYVILLGIIMVQFVTISVQARINRKTHDRLNNLENRR